MKDFISFVKNTSTEEFKRENDFKKIRIGIMGNLMYEKQIINKQNYYNDSINIINAAFFYYWNI